MCNSFDSIYSANRLLWCETSVGVLWFWPSDHQLRRSMKEQTTLIKKSHLAKKRFEILTQSLLHQTFKFLSWGWRLEMETLIYTVYIDGSMQMFGLTDWYLCQSVRGQGPLSMKHLSSNNFWYQTLKRLQSKPLWPMYE